MESIFISIAACKEEFLAQTVKSAIANASNPELLYFGICNTVIDEEDYLSDPIFELNNVHYVELKQKGPLGTGISRLMSSLMTDKEHRYFMQVDAHTIFTKGWDVLLKKSYNKLLDDYDKPIISTSPLWWIENSKKEIMLYGRTENTIDPFNMVKDIPVLKNSKNPTLEFRNNNTAFNILMNNEGNDNFILYGFVEGVEYDWKEDEEFKEHGLIHAAFVFFDFKFLPELLSDPFNPWDGDQTNISFRAGTRGYRMFAIKEACIWSRNKMPDGKLLSEYDWRLCEQTKIKNYYDTIAIKHQSKMFSGEYLGFWGAPTKESIEKYESFMGFRFKDRFIFQK
jgi:hypothetical protein